VEVIGAKRPPKAVIPELAIDTYPTRYGAIENQGYWVTSTSPLAQRPGGELAVFAEYTKTESNNSGIYAEVRLHHVHIKHEPTADVCRCSTCCNRDGREFREFEYRADCSAEGPNQYRRSTHEHFEHPSFDGIKKLVFDWIVGVARPFVAREAANQVDRITFSDSRGEWPGNLRGLQDPGRDYVYVELDDPEAFWQGRSAARRHKDGWIYAPVEQVRFADGRAFK
jgi:hypothetical protein